MEERFGMDKNTWRGGMIGAGAWATNQLEAWQKVHGAKIVALCDRHPERVQPMADRFEIGQTYQDFSEMLAHEDLNFVDICTRPYSHAALVRLAAAKGLQILCQKPFCTSLKEAQDVIAECEQAGVRLMVNENFRWQAWYRKTKLLLQEGVIGKPYQVKIQERCRATLPHFASAQAYLAEMPKLILYEMGVHYLDTLRFLFGEPEKVLARLHHISPLMQGEDVQIILLFYPEMTALIDSSWASVPVPGWDIPLDGREALIARLEIDGPVGTIFLSSDGALHLYRDGDHQCWNFPDTVEAESRAAAQDHFITCLNSGAEFETSGRETLKTMALVWSCYQSAGEGTIQTAYA
jgi:predicted dehydrogenase